MDNRRRQEKRSDENTKLTLTLTLLVQRNSPRKTAHARAARPAGERRRSLSFDKNIHIPHPTSHIHTSAKTKKKKMEETFGDSTEKEASNDQPTGRTPLLGVCSQVTRHHRGFLANCPPTGENLRSKPPSSPPVLDPLPLPLSDEPVGGFVVEVSLPRWSRVGDTSIPPPVPAGPSPGLVLTNTPSARGRVLFHPRPDAVPSAAWSRNLKRSRLCVLLFVSCGQHHGGTVDGTVYTYRCGVRPHYVHAPSSASVASFQRKDTLQTHLHLLIGVVYLLFLISIDRRWKPRWPEHNKLVQR